MSFIRKIKKGDKVYLAEVKNEWVDGKVVQKHIRYVGRELEGKVIKSSSVDNIDVTKVTIWGPLAVLNALAKEIHLSEILGDYGDYLLSLVFAHCLDPKSVNKMEDWFGRTDLHNLLDINDISEKKLYYAMDSIDDKKYEALQKTIFNSVTTKYKVRPQGCFFDVTNTYFYGSKCPLAKKGRNSKNIRKPQVQIGLAVTKEEGIPILHKTFDGNIYDARVMGDMLTSFHELGIKNCCIVWDRGISSAANIVEAQTIGFDVICGLALKENIKQDVHQIIDSHDFIKIRNRVKLKKSILYCVKEKYAYKNVAGHLIICYNEESARYTKEKKMDELEDARKLLSKGKALPSELNQFFKNKEFNEDAIAEAQKYAGYSIIFSTKDAPVQEIVTAYFEKDKVEKAFRSLKSVLGLRPIKHWIAERVKSHIFICYLSYLLISLLEYKLRNKNINAITALEKLETAYKVHIKNKRLKKEFTKTVTLTKDQEIIMKAVDKSLLKT